MIGKRDQADIDADVAWLAKRWRWARFVLRWTWRAAWLGAAWVTGLGYGLVMHH